MSASSEEGEVYLPNSIVPSSQSVEVSAGDRLKFAKQILLGGAAISCGIMAGYGCYPANPALAELSELVKIGALPIATLVISFYFTNGTKK